MLSGTDSLYHLESEDPFVGGRPAAARLGGKQLSVYEHGGKDCCSLFPLLIQRLLYAALTAAGVYFLSPFSQEIRQILACICFTPLPGLVVINTGYCHGDVERSGLLASLSILMGTVCVLTLAVIFQQI